MPRSTTLADNVEVAGDPAAQLRAMIPRSLDDVFRANRDVGTIAIASDDQLAPLRRSIAGKVAVRGRITDWRFVAITIDQPENAVWREYVYLVGRHNGAPWVTSAIKDIDRRRRLIRTLNSYYRLDGAPGEGEPPEDILINICAVFHRWGLGRMFGVPPFVF